MSTSLGEVDCWNCGHTNSTIYGNEEELVECEECNKIIALGGIDSLSIANNKEQANAFKQQIKKIEERESCNHSPDMVKPLSLFSDAGVIRVQSYLCFSCGDEIPARNIIGDGI